ncbi:hypothetical protein LDENG_00245380 [Lucifuga dentata]|nr:hypothetical protein LDENG_00245380 [Lucifuga dentata]
MILPVNNTSSYLCVAEILYLTQRKSSVIRQSIVRKYEEIQAVLQEDLRITLTHLEMEERAAISALDGLMDRNCSLIQEIEQDLARLTMALEQRDIQPDILSFCSYPAQQDTDINDRVMDVLNRSDPSTVKLDEAKADQVLGLTNNMLQLIRSQTPVTKKLISSYSSEVCLDPETAHPKLIISPQGDSAAYTDTWQEVPDLPGRFDTTLNVISSQAFSFGRHYWEIDGNTEDCWLGRGSESWCVEFFDGEYTAWHGGVPHQLPVTKHFSHIGVLCSFSAGFVTFLEADSMTPLFSFCAGAFSGCLHLAVCPGHDHNGTNSKPIVICNAHNLNSDF